MSIATYDDLKNFQAALDAREADEEKTAVAPPGWEKTVKKMKKHDEIDNPYALAWHMKNKGDTPGGKKKAMELTNFEDAVLARRVASRVVEAFAHPSEEARKKYLQKHPKADPSKHTVKKKDDKPKAAPKLPKDEGTKKPTKRELGNQIGRAENEIKKLQRWIKNDEKELEGASGKEKKEIESDIAKAKETIKEHENKLKGLKSEHEGRGRKKKDAPAGEKKDEGSKTQAVSPPSKGKWTSYDLRDHILTLKPGDTTNIQTPEGTISVKAKDPPFSLSWEIDGKRGRGDTLSLVEKMEDKGWVRDISYEGYQKEKGKKSSALAAFQQAVRARESGPSALEAFQEAVAGRVPGQLSMHQQHVMQTVNAEGGVWMIPKYRSAIKGLVRRGVLRASDDILNYFIKV